LKLRFRFTLGIMAILVFCPCLFGELHLDKLVTVEAGQKAAPPDWALLERHVLEQLYPAALEFVHHYTTPEGSLIFFDKLCGRVG